MGRTKIDGITVKWFLEAQNKNMVWIFEHKFHPKRKWRFDLACPEQRIAIEIEGGVFIKGAHGSITGILRDVEKYNEATSLGWRVIRAIPTKITLAQIEVLVKKIINLKNNV